jgi:transcriptional regulator NrdR family protein
MASYIIKRDGREEKFNKQKIMNAAKKAFVAVDGTLTKAGVNKIRRIGSEIEKISAKSKNPRTVEQIQNMV